MLQKGFPNLLGAIFLASLGWAGSILASSPASPAAPVPTKKGEAKKAPLKEYILYSVRHQGHLVLARSLPSGSCKAYLSQREGEGWLSFPPSRPVGDDFLATAAPDGSRLAFYSSRGGHVNLWTCLADGSQAEAITDEDLDIATAGSAPRASVAYAPDGKALAFLKSGDLWVYEVASKRLRSLTEDQGLRGFAWSPSGKWVAYVQLNSLRKVNATGYPTLDLATDAGMEGTLSWLPDPKREELLFFKRGVAKLDTSDKSEVLFPSAYSPNLVQVAPGKADTFLSLGPLPDGRAEAFVGTLTKKEKAMRVTQGGVETAMYWADGKGLYFVRRGKLWSCTINGAEARMLTKVEVLHPSVGQLALELPGECK